MTNKIEILSPGLGCYKTQRIINSIKKFLETKQVEFEFQIISNPGDLLKYRTWILPTVIINNKIVSHGYKPKEERIFKTLKH